MVVFLFLYVHYFIFLLRILMTVVIQYFDLFQNNYVINNENEWWMKTKHLHWTTIHNFTNTNHELIFIALSTIHLLMIWLIILLKMRQLCINYSEFLWIILNLCVLAGMTNLVCWLYVSVYIHKLLLTQMCITIYIIYRRKKKTAITSNSQLRWI